MNHFSLPKSCVEREDFLISACHGKRVLHLGFADFPLTEHRVKSGNWLHEKITGVAKECVGLDLNAESINMLKEKYQVSNVMVGDAEKLDQLKGETFDIVLAGEIVEHLNSPGLFFGSAKSALHRNSKLIVTTTNAFCLRRFIRIPFGTESIHPDHVYYFSHTTLHTLARRHGYRLVKAYSYLIPNKKPLLPYIVERIGGALSPNWGEGIIHVYELAEPKTPDLT